MVTLNVSLQGTSYQSGSAEWQYYSAVLDRLRSISGVDSVGAINYLPLAHNVYMAGAIKLDSGQQVQTVVLNGVMPGYFQTMGTRLIAGSDFTMDEGNAPEPPVIVNEAFARQAGANATIVGRRIIAPWTTRPYLISGVVATARLAGPEYDGGPQIYWPVQEEPPPALTFVVKVSGDADEYLAKCRDAVATIDRDVPLYEVQTLGQRLRETLARPRFYTTSVLFLGCLALLLAVIGVYGTSSYAIAQRRHELGVRMALGALPVNVRAMILRQSLTPVGIGMTVGIAGTIWSGHFLQHLFVGAKTPDFSTCLAASTLVLATAMVAAWCATVRILTIDPIDALRAE